MSPGIVGESDLTGSLKSEYVFFGGERVARRDLPGGTVAYYFSDHLKTASVITNAAGTITEDEDYYPWGGELQFVNSDSNHYKFTGKERDAETGLDYFGARYYGNWLGRWMSPDWAAKPEAVPYSDLGDPQSLNLYSYVRNVPTSRADPDGHEDAATAVMGWVVSHPQAAAAIAATADKIGAVVTAIGSTVSKVATTTVGTAVLAVSYLVSPGSGGANSSNDTHGPAANVGKGSPPPGTQTKTGNPSRPGTLGKPDHQQTVKEEAERLNGQAEKTIPTEGGLKDSRRADAVGTNPETGAPEIVQVYRPTPAGNIPKREVDAANDIGNATGIKPTMVPVRPAKPDKNATD